MHELALMRDVVRMIEEVLADAPQACVRRVSLKVSAQSHVGQADSDTAATALAAAAAGTRVEGARLELIVVPLGVQCLSCGARVEVADPIAVCESCGSSNLRFDDVPELVLHELDVE